MLDHLDSNMGTQEGGLGPGPQYLDSAQAENNFLSAIGFQSATSTSKPITKSGQPPRAQQANQSTNNTQSSVHGAKAQKIPVNPAQRSLSRAQNQDNTRWRNNQPSAPQRHEGQERPSAERRGAAAPKPSIAPSKPPQTRCPAPDPNAWPKPNEVSPAKSKATINLPNRQLRCVLASTNLMLKQLPDNTKPRSSSTQCGQRAVPNPNRLDHMSPNLAARPIPRPNRDYAGSEYSLPSLGSGINNDDDAKGMDNSIADIRHTIGLVPNIHASGNSWTKYNWENPTGKDYDEEFVTHTYLGSFIGAWMNGIPDNVRASFDQGVEEHWKCDIDTITGHLLPPLSIPDAMADVSQLDLALEPRRLNWCSELFIQRRLTNPRSRNNNWRPAKNSHNVSSYVEYEAPPVVTKVVSSKVHEVGKVETPEYQRFVPRITCFLRPAEKFDMEAVQRIYNWEVEHGMQALDSQPLSVEEFEKILATAQQLGMPFIVAVRGSARGLGLTKGNLAYSPFRQVPFRDKSKRGEILGFGFLSVWQPGLAGSGIGSSRASAKMHVFVHQDYRRKKIGFSLLDMLLRAASDRFSSQSGYDFVDPDDSPVYKCARDSERQYFHIYSSFLVRHKLRADGNKKLQEEQKTYDKDLAWMKVLHEDMLNFTEMVRLEAVHRSPKSREGPVYWMDEVLFEHSGYFDPTQVTEGY